MAEHPRLVAFEKSIQSARAFCDANSDTEACMKKIKFLLETLVNDPAMRAHAKT